MNKSIRNIFLVFLGILFLAGSFSGGLLVGWLIPAKIPQINDLQSNISATAAPGNSSSTDNSTLFKPFWEAWQIIHDQYIDQPVDNTKLMQGAIRGMVGALGDSHTLYMDPSEYAEATVPLSGTYAGIGAFVKTNGEYLTIKEPIEGSPAERAGLKPGDEVIALNGKDVTGIEPSVVLESVKGPAGTTVKLTIHRSNPESTFDVTITRETINYPTVTGKILQYSDLPENSGIFLSKKIAYISLTSFGETTADDLQEILTKLQSEKPNGIILDLRNNSGGYLTTAVDVISQFIGEGVIVYEEESSGNMVPYNAISGGLALDTPLVVLVDEGSASASEITAGAIQDYHRGTLVGTTTYGKGSVQYWIPLQDNQGAVAVTVARWLTPNKRQINDIGLTPDYVVEYTDEDLKNGYDSQLIKAIEILLQK